MLGIFHHYKNIINYYEHRTHELFRSYMLVLQNDKLFIKPSYFNI